MSSQPVLAVLSTKIFRHSKFSVRMGADGAIRVKGGDVLSKYAAAIRGDFTKLNEFGRLDSLGNLRRIPNVNLIFAGETIYHMPTYRLAHPIKLDDLTVYGSPLSESQKMEMIRSGLKGDFDLHGELLEWVDHLHLGLHGTAKVGEIPVMIGEALGWLVEGSLLATVVTIVDLVASCLEPICVGIAVINASDAGKKLIGNYAICYALTAWAFGNPIPSFPTSLKQKLPNYGSLGFEQAWREASTATVRNLESKLPRTDHYVLKWHANEPELILIDRHEQRKKLQMLWQSLGDWDAPTLVGLLMEARAEELSDAVKNSFLGTLDPTRYPN
jgi:hypothetical protein